MKKYFSPLLRFSKKSLGTSLFAMTVMFPPRVGRLPHFGETATDLPKLHINTQLVTVSGVSSGGAMALQMLVAASDKILGAGVVAGLPYSCALSPNGNVNDNAERAQKLCMKAPEQINVDQLVAITNQLSQKGQIAPIVNLRARTLYIFDGTQDTVVLPQAGVKISEYASKYLNPRYIRTEFSVDAGHGFPTVANGNPCAQQSLPWINRCNYDAAYNIFQQLYQQNLRQGRANPQNLVKYNQAPFVNAQSLMANEGYIYVPTACKGGQIKCALHVAFHGCLQNPTVAQDAFIARAGYNDWAEANNIVVLYPTVNIGSGNPAGCWDWWGYSGANYMTRNAPQIQAVLKMIDQLAQ